MKQILAFLSENWPSIWKETFTRTTDQNMLVLKDFFQPYLTGQRVMKVTVK